MESFSLFFDSQSRSSSRSGWTYDCLKNLRQISPIVQTHLKQVYVLLCFALIASSVGAYLHIIWNIGGNLTLVGTTHCMSWLFATPPYKEHKRVSLLLALFFLLGASLGDVINTFIAFDPSILVSVFMGFSGAAMLTRRREYLYLGGFLSFGGSVALFKFKLYFGLLVFVGYIVVDTQESIEKAHLGDLDYVKHAIKLSTDFIVVFVRALTIIWMNSAKRTRVFMEKLLLTTNKNAM